MKNKNYKILIAEDEDSLRMIYEEYLGGEGFTVLAVSNGEDAVKTVRSNLDIDLILLDIMMPKIDGVKALELLKKDEKTKNLKIYLMTVLGNENVIKKAFDLGADGYLIKDTLTPDQIKSEIIAAIEK